MTSSLQLFDWPKILMPSPLSPGFATAANAVAPSASDPSGTSVTFNTATLVVGSIGSESDNLDMGIEEETCPPPCSTRIAL